MVFMLDERLAADETGKFGIADQVGPVQILVDQRPGHERPGQIDLLAGRFIFFQHKKPPVAD